jgi:hypothetical protein
MLGISADAAGSQATLLNAMPASTTANIRNICDDESGAHIASTLQQSASACKA